MKQLLTIMLMAALTAGAQQTLSVSNGSITYYFPATDREMPFTAPNTLTIDDLGFNLAEYSSMEVVDICPVEPNSVMVTYDGDRASALIHGSVAKYVNVTISGADVQIAQSELVSESTCGEITYILAGASQSGSLTLGGSYKASVELNGLTLTNPSGAAIDIQNGKRISLSAKSGTSNILADGPGTQKGAINCKGHLELKGKGSLTVTGNQAHAIFAKEYLTVKNLTLTIPEAVKDGINCNQYFAMESGSIEISAAGDDGIQVSFKDETDREAEDTGAATISGGTLNVSIAKGSASKGIKADGDVSISGGEITIATACNGKWDSTELKTKGSACIGTNGNITIGGGTLNLTASGSGGKGMTCDGIFTSDGGSAVITTTGGMLVYSSGSLNHNYTGSSERVSSNYKSSAKGIKADNGLVINDGALRIFTSGNNAEGLESKTTISITGGETFIKAYDDGLNSSRDLTVSGGKVTAISTVGDAIDSNANLYISGGEVIALGAGGAEQGLDAADESRCAVYITGGNVLSCGGRSAPVSTTTGSQALITVSSSVSANSTVSIASGSETLASFEIPAEYSPSSSGGQWPAPGNRPGGGGWNPGGSGSGNLLLSCPALVGGKQYNVVNGSSTTSVTAS